MNFLFIDTYYSAFLKSFHRLNPAQNHKSYDIQKKNLLRENFGTSDFYSYNLMQLGHYADDIIANDEISQKTWARENNIQFSNNGLISRIQLLPYIHRFIGRPKWIQEIVLAQIKQAKPDILYIQDLSILNPDTILAAKKYAKLIVGQIASPLPSSKQLLNFDLLITSFPHFVQQFKKMNINSEYLPLAFEPRILKKINTKKMKKTYEVSFVGSFSYYHSKGSRILKEVVKYIPVNIWGSNPGFGNHYHGESWGLDMMRILSKSKIIINRHINVAQDFANNMRLFESTGMGAMLITDEKANLGDLFHVGKEIETYKNSQDLIMKINYYLSHEEERNKIALAGQKRTLKDHNYLYRMKQLVTILDKYI